MEIYKQVLCKICCQAVLYWKRKVSFQDELYIQWELLPSFNASYFSKTVLIAVKYYSTIIETSIYVSMLL